jgi:hypothetical protein
LYLQFRRDSKTQRQARRDSKAGKKKLVHKQATQNSKARVIKIDTIFTGIIPSLTSPPFYLPPFTSRLLRLGLHLNFVVFSCFTQFHNRCSYFIYDLPHFITWCFSENVPHFITFSSVCLLGICCLLSA